MLDLILSSGSTSRYQLLKRYNYPFEVFEPDIDESLMPNESVETAVKRLAIAKANAATTLHPQAIIIGCDQLICVNQTILGKPLTHQAAIEQLSHCSHQLVHSYTGLALLNSSDQQCQATVINYQIKYKTLDRPTIERYLNRDQPYHCAGSIKAESLGPCLFEWMRGDDPSALIGLPLIALNNMLRNQNIDVLAHTATP